MKQKVKAGLMIAVVVLVAICAIVGIYYAVYTVKNMPSDADVHLQTASSPGGKYTLEVYRTEAGATVDFAIKVFLKEGNHTKKIYDAYHECEATIRWLSENTVRINEVTLHLDKGETYDWRKGG